MEKSPEIAGHRIRIGLAVALVALLFAPVVVDRDDFPLSTYPIYSRTRGPVVTLATAYGLDADEDEQQLTLELIGESDDPLIVAGELRVAIAEGRADQRCQEIASRVDRSAVRAVVIVTETHNTIERTLDRPSLRDRTVHARCDVQVAA